MQQDSHSKQVSTDVANRLLESAQYLFLEFEYHKVTTRKIAERASTTPAMIKYYFESKQALYHEVIRLQNIKFNQAIESALNPDLTLNYRQLFRNCYAIFKQHPKLAPFLVRIMVYKDAPGYHYLKSLMNTGQKLAMQMTTAEQQQGTIKKGLNPDVLRVVTMSLSTYPLLIQSLLSDQIGNDEMEDFLNDLAEFSADIYEQGIRPEGYTKQLGT